MLMVMASKVGSFTSVTSSGRSSTKATTFLSTAFELCWFDESIRIVPDSVFFWGTIIPVYFRRCIQSFLKMPSPILLQHLERRRGKKARAAFFFRVVQYIFINPVQQIAG